MIVVRTFPQLMSLLSLDPLLPVAPPPDRRAALQPAPRWLRAAPPLGKGNPSPNPIPIASLDRLPFTPNHSNPVCTETGEAHCELMTPGSILPHRFRINCMSVEAWFPEWRMCQAECAQSLPRIMTSPRSPREGAGRVARRALPAISARCAHDQAKTSSLSV